MKKTKYNESGTTILLTLFVTVIMLTLITSIVIATYSSSRKLTDWNRSKLAEIKTENVLYQYLNEKVQRNEQVLEGDYTTAYQSIIYQIKLTRLEEQTGYSVYQVKVSTSKITKYLDASVKLTLADGLITKYEILTKVFVNA